VPVTVVTEAARLPAAAEGTAVVRLEPPLHDHAPGTACIACESRGNVRVLLFELDEKVRRGMIPPFGRVIVDATGIADPQAVADAIVPGRLPAMGMRDHTVARNFHLDARV
jgi:G3E family GTPase